MKAPADAARDGLRGAQAPAGALLRPCTGTPFSPVVMRVPAAFWQQGKAKAAPVLWFGTDKLHFG